MTKIKTPYASLTVLALFMQKQLTLTEDEYDRHFESITDFLADINDCRYLLTPKGDEKNVEA